MIDVPNQRHLTGFNVDILMLTSFPTLLKLAFQIVDSMFVNGQQNDLHFTQFDSVLAEYSHGRIVTLIGNLEDWPIFL